MSSESTEDEFNEDEESSDKSMSEEECGFELDLCIELLLKHMEEEKKEWPKTKEEFMSYAGQFTKFPFSWNKLIIITALSHANLIKVSKADQRVTFNIDKIKAYKLADTKPLLIQIVNKFKRESKTDMEDVKVQSMQKTIAWLKSNIDKLGEYKKLKELQKVLVEVSTITVNVELEAIIEELEYRKLIEFSKKDESSIKYNLDHLKYEDKESQLCRYILLFTVLGSSVVWALTQFD